MVAAAEDQVENIGNLLQRKFETRRIGIIGAAEYLNKELDVLHRFVRVINSELMEIEADQKHVPQLLEDLARYLKGGLRQEKYCVIPRRCPPKRSWKLHVDSDCAETQYRVEAHLARFFDEENTLLRHNVIGLSSAESEYDALTKGGCAGLGLQSSFADWNLSLRLSLHTDSSSARAVAARRGAGQSTRHIQPRMLWLQERHGKTLACL